MLAILQSIIWCLFRRVVARSSLEADLIALRLQVGVLQRQISNRPKLTRWDRLLFAALYRVQPDVLRSISIVRPETVVRWHRAGFRLYWKHKSRSKSGRPRVAREVRALIREISIANPLWGGTTYPRRAAQARYRCLAVDGRQVHGSSKASSIARLAHIFAKPCRRYCPLTYSLSRLSASESFSASSFWTMTGDGSFISRRHTTQRLNGLHVRS